MTMAPMFSRRRFLSSGLMIGCSAAASPLLTPIAFAQAPGDARLVVIILRGALDGLDAIPPLGDPAYAGLRPTLSREPVTQVADFWGLHDSLSPLLPLWQSQEFGAVHAVSTPYRDRRSHFDGQDILEAGTQDIGGTPQGDGWLNRMLTAVPGVTAETAWAIGTEQLLILSGQTPISRWSPETRLAVSPQARLLLEAVYATDPLFQAASEGAFRIVDEFEAEGVEADNTGNYSLRLAEFAAQRLRGDARIASFSLNGWDTHANQAAALPRALRNLTGCLLALKEGLGPVWGQTAVLCLTEFGRTARENGTKGTDHGTGGAMLFAGGALRGGQVMADWPGLSDGALYAERDLMPTRDVRAHAAWIMRGLYGLSRDVLEGAVFPGLDMGSDPGLIA
jgi:uncharacterized protein (DUF1501 family)